jgi:AraC-like DNA-binding protein
MLVTTHSSPIGARFDNPISNPLLQDIEIIIKTSLGDHPSFDMLASAFNMSGRTLRRQLAGAGTSYQKLVDGFRCDYAIECLQEGTMSTEDIADGLGFSDVANFRHAFKKWSGSAPTAYRIKEIPVRKAA